jgi:hypothetical protein
MIARQYDSTDGTSCVKVVTGGGPCFMIGVCLVAPMVWGQTRRSPAQGYSGQKCLQDRLQNDSIRRWTTRQANQKPRLSGAFGERMMGLEPTTFCMASRRSSQLSYIRVGRAF